MTKQDIRKLVRERLASWDGSMSDCLSIWQKIEDCRDFQDARTVLLYWSIGFEIPTSEIICKWNGTKRLALPVVVGNDLILRKYDPAKMVEGYRGIMEPSPEAAIISPEEVDFAIVPGLAFDVNNNRMGRGKGYYDRLLPSLRNDCTVVGVCWREQLFEEIPVDEWDFALSAVVTP